MTIKEITTKFGIEIKAVAGNSQYKNEAMNTNGGILFNLKPVFHLNVIHFALFTYLRAFSKACIPCTVILLDLTTYSGDFNEEIKNQEEANRAMDWLYRYIVKFVGRSEYIEIIPETSLILLYNRNKQHSKEKTVFIHDLIKSVKLAESFQGIDLPHEEQISALEKTKDDPKKYVNNKSFDQISSLCCLLYEWHLRPSYVITAWSEKESLWTKIRNNGSLTQIFGPDYYSPLLLTLPSIKKHDSDNIILTDDKNDLFCEEVNYVTPNAFYSNIIKRLNEDCKISATNEPLEIVDAFKKIMYPQS